MKAGKLEVTRNVVSQATFEIDPIERKPAAIAIQRLDFLEGENIEIRLQLYIKDYRFSNFPMADKIIEINLNRNTYYAVTDEKGIASLLLLRWLHGNRNRNSGEVS